MPSAIKWLVLTIMLSAGYPVAAQTPLQKGIVELRTYRWDGSTTTSGSLAIAGANNGDVASLTTTRTVEGLDTSGLPSQMVVTAIGIGQANVASLRAAASIAVVDPVMPTGTVSNTVFVQSTGWLWEHLLVGNSEVRTIRFGMRIDGTLAASRPEFFEGVVRSGASVALFQGDGVNFSNSRLVYGRSSSSSMTTYFNDYVLSNEISVVNGMAELNIQFLAQTDVSINEAATGTFEAQSLFDHTASLFEVYGYDGAGTQVALPDVRTASGHIYQAASLPAVPEPSQHALLLMGLAALGVVCQRKRSAVRQSLR